MSEPDVKTPRIALLGIPLEIGASQRGTLMGPDPTMLSVNLAKVSEGDMRTEINHMPAEPPYLFVVTPQGEEFAAHAA